MIAEQLSAAGVPVLMADVKGDLSGLTRPGEPGDPGEPATKPQLFSTFLMWLPAELYEELPEEGDLDKPKPVFFCTQQPTDIPDAVLSQLGARVQHALRAFTPNDQEQRRERDEPSMAEKVLGTRKRHR